MCILHGMMHVGWLCWTCRDGGLFVLDMWKLWMFDCCLGGCLTRKESRVCSIKGGEGLIVVVMSLGMSVRYVKSKCGYLFV